MINEAAWSDNYCIGIAALQYDQSDGGRGRSLTHRFPLASDSLGPHCFSVSCPCSGTIPPT